MHCLICGSENEYYFSKTYTEKPFNEFMRDIGTVDYHRCKSCGFVISKTHSTLDSVRWAELNSKCHQYFENPNNEKRGNQPPYAEQALMLLLLGKHGIIDLYEWIDYAAGHGTLSRLLEKYFQLHLPIFDPYVRDGDASRYVDEPDWGAYKTVINSAMFEHVRTRDDLDMVNRLVSADGCLVLHTVVCESIPKDPNWFYLRPPVHTAFHTNKSMDILMQQWGYVSSLYCPKSKCWVLLKTADSRTPYKLKALNEELQSEWFYFKDGFVNYWKGF